jgi:hypothetical protein
MHRFTAWVAGVLLLALTNGAVADGDDVEKNDIQCLVLGLQMAQSPDNAQNSTAMMVTFYYLGRLDGRNPALDLENRIIDETSAMSKLPASDLNKIRTRCGSELTTRGQQLTVIGGDIIKRAQQ